MESLYRGDRFPSEIVSHAVWIFHRFTLSFRDVEDLLAVSGVTVSYEAIALWFRHFGHTLARNLRRRHGQLGDVWHVDEVFITIRGERRYLWRAVDQDGDVLDILVTCRRDARAAKRFFRKLLKGRGGSPFQPFTDKLRSYVAARRELGLSTTHRTGPYEKNRAEVPHQHTTERERQMRHFKAEAHPQCILAVHAAVQDSFRGARHRLKAIHHRLCREQAVNTWKSATCVG